MSQLTRIGIAFYYLKWGFYSIIERLFVICFTLFPLAMFLILLFIVLYAVNFVLWNIVSFFQDQ